MEKIFSIARLFQIDGEPTHAEIFGNGHINSTFKIETDTDKKYILQKINTSIFKNSDQLMENIENITSHLKKIVI